MERSKRRRRRRQEVAEHEHLEEEEEVEEEEKNIGAVKMIMATLKGDAMTMTMGLTMLPQTSSTDESVGMCR